MISIVISTSNRLNYLKNTMNDLIKISSIIDKIIIFSFNDHFSANIIKQKYSHKFKNIISINAKNNQVLEDRIHIISTIKSDLVSKSKYIWFLSDKDRILSNKFLSIKKDLKRNVNGITINVISLKKNRPKKINKNLNFNFFEIDKGIHKIGLISSHIIKTSQFLKYSKGTKLSAYYLGEIIVKIILHEKKWLFIKDKIIGYNHINNDRLMNKDSVKYINYRITQEFIFYIQKINIILKYKNKKLRRKVILRAFIKNILGWIIFLKTKDNINSFKRKINNYKIYYNNYFVIKIIIVIITYTPLGLINIIKKIR